MFDRYEVAILIAAGLFDVPPPWSLTPREAIELLPDLERTRLLQTADAVIEYMDPAKAANHTLRGIIRKAREARMGTEDA
jgi:hypothetical protein